MQITAISNRITERIEELNSNRGESKKITVRSIAKTAGITENYLWKIISGERTPSMKIQFAIALALKSEINEIFLPVVLT